VKEKKIATGLHQEYFSSSKLRN